MTLREAIDARLAAESGAEVDELRRLLRELLTAFERGGSDEVTASLVTAAGQFKTRSDALLATLRRRVQGIDDD